MLLSYYYYYEILSLSVLKEHIVNYLFQMEAEIHNYKSEFLQGKVAHVKYITSRIMHNYFIVDEVEVQKQQYQWRTAHNEV